MPQRQEDDSPSRLGEYLFNVALMSLLPPREDGSTTTALATILELKNRGQMPIGIQCGSRDTDRWMGIRRQCLVRACHWQRHWCGGAGGLIRADPFIWMLVITICSQVIFCRLIHWDMRPQWTS